MKSKNLLSQLSDLESALGNFSFEELSVEEASRLKASFTHFKKQLERRIWNDPEPKTSSATENAKKTDGNAGRLIATVSHEMRTPLNGIIGFTDLLLEGNLNSDQSEHVEAIRSASQTLIGIINELLEYSKLSAELERLESVDFNFRSVVNEVFYLCKTLIVGKEVKLKISIDEQIPENLTGDPSKLSQVLLNLLGNAIKFVEKGIISLKINTERIQKTRHWLQFEIKDTGIGISEADLKNIFDSFRQANEKTFAKYGGSGLGLNIVKQIIEKQEGEIQVESELGQGTTFTFSLPFEKAEKKVKAKKVKAQEKLPKWIKGMHILVFEDNLLNQRLIGSRLKSWGCKYYITDNALHGLGILENSPIEMVLMDLRMPGMSGFEVTAKIRESAEERISKVPVIALTADFTIEDKDECQNSGIDDYLLKPYSPNELLDKIKKNRKSMEHIIEIPSDRRNETTDNLSSSTQIDLEPVLEECMGEITLLEELVSLYKQNALEFIGQLKVHLAQRDFEAIGFAAHKIKSGLKMMRSESLLSLVEQIHKESKTDKDIKHLQFLHRCFVEEYPQVERLIDEEMKLRKK